MINKIVAVDFDGTVVEHNFPYIGKPLPHAFEVLKEMKKLGYTLILWTCRNNNTEKTHGYSSTLKAAVEFCKKNGVEFDAANENVTVGFNPMPKIYYDVLIDDRNFDTTINWPYIKQHLVDKYKTSELTQFKEFVNSKTESSNYQAPKRIVEPAKHDPLYFYMENELNKAKKTN